LGKTLSSKLFKRLNRQIKWNASNCTPLEFYGSSYTD
jgi:hypothetical protein